MENTVQDVERIKQTFQSCQKVFATFGDETRIEKCRYRQDAQRGDFNLLLFRPAGA